MRLRIQELEEQGKGFYGQLMEEAYWRNFGEWESSTEMETMRRGGCALEDSEI